MIQRKWINMMIVAALILTVWIPATVVQAADGPPSYQLQFLGSGSPVAINNNGIVVGRTLIPGTSNYQPWVSSGGATWSALPSPAGAMSVFPTDINDQGVIVGVSFASNWNPVAVRWTPSAGGYTLEELPRLAGDASSYAMGINNLGQIVGARRTLGYAPTGSGWFYDPQNGLVDLAAQYGWWTWPSKINDLGQIIGGAERLDINTGVLEWIGNGPSNYNAVGAVDINNSGMMAGTASLRSTSLNIVSAFRYVNGAGWQFIYGSSKYTTVSSINSQGDVGFGESGAGLYLEGLGVYALGNLLDQAVTAAGWRITGSGALINDSRVVTTVASNSTTGQSGAVLLTPAGTLPPPTAPANLQGVPHVASYSEPYNSINLTWENTSSLTQGYELERSVAGSDTWTLLALTPPGTATQHTDTTIDVGVTYNYRVRATGLGGKSPSSNVITVTAPSTPLDTTPPVVSLLSPANGASISGTVAVTAQATDNVGVKYLEISFWNQYTGQQVILGSVENASSLTVNWNTSGLTPAAYTLRGYAYDALGNFSQTEITVNVTTSTNTFVVSSISLTGKVSSSTVNLTGDVYVKNSSGQVVPDALVSIRWTLPNNTTRVASATTSTSGRARFVISGSRGTYTLTVTNVTKTGYTFDAARSVLAKSIRK